MIVSFANKDSFMSSFQTCIPFISLSCFIVLLILDPNLMLKSHDGRRHTCLVSDINRKASSFSSLSMMLVVRFF